MALGRDISARRPAQVAAGESAGGGQSEAMQDIHSLAGAKRRRRTSAGIAESPSTPAPIAARFAAKRSRYHNFSHVGQASSLPMSCVGPHFSAAERGVLQ
jgi:hypothetical protein